MGKKRETIREVLGAILGIGVFALAVLGLNWKLGWPNSWPTLVATGTLSFLASALASRTIRRPWAAHAGAACALILLVSCPLVGWPFRVLPQEQGGYETRYAYFITYILGTEDNGPIENVVVDYLVPNVDNWYPQDEEGPLMWSRWILYYLEDNGNLEPQVIFWRRAMDLGWEVQELQLCGMRKEPPKFLASGIIQHSLGFSEVTFIDKLYPREVLWEECKVKVPRGKEENLTLRVAGLEDNISSATILQLPSADSFYQAVMPNQPFNKTIHVRFVSQLWKSVCENSLQRVEFYQREIEFSGNVGVRLFPVA